MSELVKIATLRQAINLVDQWTGAYKRDMTVRDREIRTVNDELFWTRVDVNCWQSQAILYRAQLIAAGVPPLDALQDVGVIAAGATIA